MGNLSHLGQAPPLTRSPKEVKSSFLGFLGKVGIDGSSPHHPPPIPTPTLWTLSRSTGAAVALISSLEFPLVDRTLGPHTFPSQEKPGQAQPLTACWLFFRAVLQVVLAGFCGGLITYRAGDPRNGGQVPWGCFGHR